MRSLFRQAMVGAIVLLPVIGGIALVRHGNTPTVSVARTPATDAVAEIAARRAEMDQRISEGRRTGRLHGVGYLAILDEQHRLLVRQKRAEAQGLSEEARREFLRDLDRASANIDKQLAN